MAFLAHAPHAFLDYGDVLEGDVSLVLGVRIIYYSPRSGLGHALHAIWSACSVGYQIRVHDAIQDPTQQMGMLCCCKIAEISAEYPHFFR